MIFALFLALVHYTYMYQAGQTLDDATQEAARVLMLENGTETRANAAAAHVINNDPAIEGWSLAIVDANTVQLSGTSVTILPGLPTQLERTVSFSHVGFLNEEDR